MILQTYEELCKKVSDESFEITEEIKIKFVEDMKKIDKDQHENIYFLIKKYYYDDVTDTILSETLPYAGKKLKKSMRFDFDKLPSNLQQILITYIDEK